MFEQGDRNVDFRVTEADVDEMMKSLTWLKTKFEGAAPQPAGQPKKPLTCPTCHSFYPKRRMCEFNTGDGTNSDHDGACIECRDKWHGSAAPEPAVQGFQQACSECDGDGCAKCDVDGELDRRGAKIDDLQAPVAQLERDLENERKNWKISDDGYCKALRRAKSAEAQVARLIEALNKKSHKITKLSIAAQELLDWVPVCSPGSSGDKCCEKLKAALRNDSEVA